MHEACIILSKWSSNGSLIAIKLWLHKSVFLMPGNTLIHLATRTLHFELHRSPATWDAYHHQYDYPTRQLLSRIKQHNGIEGNSLDPSGIESIIDRIANLICNKDHEHTYSRIKMAKRKQNTKKGIRIINYWKNGTPIFHTTRIDKKLWYKDDPTWELKTWSNQQRVKTENDRSNPKKGGRERKKGMGTCKRGGAPHLWERRCRAPVFDGTGIPND